MEGPHIVVFDRREERHLLLSKDRWGKVEEGRYEPLLLCESADEVREIVPELAAAQSGD